jgi:hypothetical protein
VRTDGTRVAAMFCALARLRPEQTGTRIQFQRRECAESRGGRTTALLQRCPNCGERGSMREKGIDGRHAEADSLGFGNQPGTIRERKRVYP